MAMGMGNEVRILVTPETLKNTADEFFNIEKEALDCVNNMIMKVNELENKWKGEASQAYVRKFRNLRDDMEKIFRMIQEHVEDLKKIADRYSQVEQESQELISDLADDIVL